MGPKPIMDNPRKAISRATADKQIRAFKRNIKAVTERTLGHDGDLKLFKPTKAKQNSLQGCGILGRINTPSFNICINSGEQEASKMRLPLPCPS